ncbi:MAG: S8 family serine peptidase [Promethearchaeati archaeon SRVP18_Atabeyarchaeia-1]
MSERTVNHYSMRLLAALMISAVIIAPTMIVRAPSLTSNGQKQTVSSDLQPAVAKVDPLLKGLIDHQSSADIEVIVVFRDGVDMNSVGKIIGAGGSLKLISTFNVIPAAVVKGPLSIISGLVSVKEIRSLYLNKEIMAIPLNGTSGTIATVSRTSPWISAIDLPPLNVANGSGVKIAVADSGIDATHPDLAGKVVASQSFVNTIYGYLDNETNLGDDFGHGTYVAGIAAGSGVLNPEYRGVAPMAKLLNAKCIDSFGRGFTAGIIAAIQWSVGNGADVISLSLGGGSADPDDPLSLAVDSAARSGVVVVVAAGNNGPYYSTGETPAAARLAISVGAYNESNSIASFSSRGPTLDGRPYPDVLAPGVGIWSTLASLSSVSLYAYRLGISYGGYVKMDGTSAATPFVSGAAALLLSASGLSLLNRTALPSQLKVEIPTTVRIALMHTANSLGADANAQGAGLIDVSAAYTYLVGFGNRLHYPVLSVYPRQLINPPYFVGYLGDSLQLGATVLTAFTANLNIAVSGNATSFINLSNTSLANIVGFTGLYVNVSIPVNAALGRYVAQIGFQNTTTHEFVPGQNITVSFSVENPKGRVYFDLFHTDSAFSIMSVLYKLATTLRSRGYSTYENNEPIDYSKISQYDVLVLTDPKIMFGSEETNAIQRFVDNNGSLLVLGTDYPDMATEKVNEITAKYGVEFAQNLVSKYTDLVFAKVITSNIVITDLSSHPVTSGLTSYLYGYGSTLSISSPAIPIAFTPAEYGTLATLAACDVPEGGRVVASGGIWFATDDYLTSAAYPGNLKLAENIFDWLLGKVNASLETIVSSPRVRTGESLQIGVTVTNRTTGGLLSSTLACIADNGSMIPIELKSDIAGIYYNMTVELEAEGFYKFSVNAKTIIGGLNIDRIFYVEVVNTPPDILNITLSTYNNPAYKNQLPVIYRSLLPDGTPIILRHNDSVTFTIAVSGLEQPDSNVTVYLTRSRNFYLANDKPLTYVSLRASQVNSTVYYVAKYLPSTGNTTDVYTYWISANSAGHTSTFNSVGLIMVASIDPEIDNATTTIDTHPLIELRTPVGHSLQFSVLPVYAGDALSIVIRGSSVEDNVTNMKAYAILFDYDLYIIPGLVDSELIVSPIPYNSMTGSFQGSLLIPESGLVTLPGTHTTLSLIDDYFLILILFVDSNGAYAADYAMVYVLQAQPPLFPVEVIFAVLVAAVAVPLLVILLLSRGKRKRLEEGPPPNYYSPEEPTKTSTL